MSGRGVGGPAARASTMAPMTEKQMPTMAVQPRPREVKVNEERAPLETNNNTRMVNGGNIDYNKLISPDNVPGKNISSDAATTPTLVEGKKEAAEAKKPQVWMCHYVRTVRACVKATNRFPDLPLHCPRRNHTCTILEIIKKAE